LIKLSVIVRDIIVIRQRLDLSLAYVYLSSMRVRKQVQKYRRELMDDWPLTREETLRNSTCRRCALPARIMRRHCTKRLCFILYCSTFTNYRSIVAEVSCCCLAGHFVSQFDIASLGKLLSFLEKNPALIKERLST